MAKYQVVYKIKLSKSKQNFPTRERLASAFLRIINFAT